MNQPWDRMTIDGVAETDKAFSAFQCYLEMGPERAYRAVAKELGKSETLIAKWGKRWRWTSRITAWEDHQAEIKRRAHAEELEEIGRRHARIGRDLLEEVAAEVVLRRERREQYQRELEDALLAEADGVPERKDAPSPGDLARLAKTGVDIERTAAGLATSKVETDVTVSPAKALAIMDPESADA